MAYLIEYLPSAKKALGALQQNMQKLIIKAIKELNSNPRPYGYKKLKSSNTYRIRVGDYRIVYEIRDDILMVLVIRIGHRREVYKTIC